MANLSQNRFGKAAVEIRLERQVALPKILCQNCPKMILTKINKTKRLSLFLMVKTVQRYLCLNQNSQIKQIFANWLRGKVS